MLRQPFLPHALARGPRIGLPGAGVRQFGAVLVEQARNLRHRRLVRLATRRAEAPGETLRQDAEQRIGEVERVHAHVEQAIDRFRRTVGVQRRQDQMAGQ
ncbi:MAG: hypothetical protein AW08_02081 [Candidatus Accumulibacter adjunctus]|uniref:Uncharacterized protein n=1 Tax=Candidatus Accumulibacter adjunctus TaxID=1454001 RepID=A0A011MXF0_9PROT|nr:MAG: hypothetical protein AW08_02081 [Candidatus Accumulibacter adjunctus]